MSEPVRLSEALDQQAIGHLDFEPGCSLRMVHVEVINGIWVSKGPAKDCSHPAVWMATCTRCGKGAYVCEPHHVAILGLPLVACAACRAEGETGLLLRFQPLPSGGAK